MGVAKDQLLRWRVDQRGCGFLSEAVWLIVRIYETYNTKALLSARQNLIAILSRVF